LKVAQRMTLVRGLKQIPTFRSWTGVHTNPKRERGLQ